MAPLVSILIPAYRAESLITQTVRSVLDQTWPNIEVIIVDDGSPDGTFQVAKRLECDKVKVVRQDNAGAPSARNAAFKLAQGEYIQWLDADDVLHPQKIEKQLIGAESGLTSQTLLTCSWGKFFFRTEKAVFTPDPLWRDHGPVEWILAKFQNHWMNPAVWLVSRRLTEQAGAWDPRLAKSGDDDGEYIIRIVAGSEGVRFVPDARCYYRIATVGSLNWNMETNPVALQSLVLSLTTSIRHLLALEDSARTRLASVQYLETFLPYFYGCDERYYNSLSAVARELGHDLPAPHVSWKYRPLELLAGPTTTRQVVTNWRAWKLLMRRRYDLWRYERRLNETVSPP